MEGGGQKRQAGFSKKPQPLGGEQGKRESIIIRGKAKRGGQLKTHKGRRGEV